MVTALADLAARGLRLTLTERGTVTVAPRALVTPEVIEHLHAHKLELLRSLTSAAIADAAINSTMPLWLYDHLYPRPAHNDPLPVDLLPEDLARVLAALPPRTPAPIAARTIRPYTNPRPTLPCRRCGAKHWREWPTPAGLNWRCTACHPQ